MNRKEAVVLLSLVCLACISGCQEKQAYEPNPIDRSAVNRSIVDTYSDLAIQNAIIAQHSLYPYHFIANSAHLNDLGKRDLSVLIEHYKLHPGLIMVQQGADDELLHQSRAQIVFEKMLEAGIPQDKINVTTGMPGGDGMPAGSVVEILEKAKTAPKTNQNQNAMQIVY